MKVTNFLKVSTCLAGSRKIIRYKTHHIYHHILSTEKTWSVELVRLTVSQLLMGMKLYQNAETLRADCS